METQRLIIDAVRKTDKEDYFNNISHDRKVLETFVCRYAETLDEFDFTGYPGREDLFAVRLKETGRLIGILTYFDVKDGGCEIGYGLGSAWWGRGYAAEAVRRFIDWLFDEKGLETVCASYFTGNEDSRRVMEKCGMVWDHYSPKEMTYLGTERDLVYYALRKDDRNKHEEVRKMQKEEKKVRNLAVVSLSAGTIGEPFVQFEVEIGLQRLRDFGLNVRFMPHALKGREYVKNHPEKRAEDLLEAFRDPETDMILCAIGGDDTFRLLPYLFENGELKDAVRDKIFLGFSDTTINHLMLYKVGLKTFYGQSFLADICEIGPDMLPYSKKYFEELITKGGIREIRPSSVWYRQRERFVPEDVGKALEPLTDHGFELLQGVPVFSGKILGGCIESLHDMFNGERYEEMPLLCGKYRLFPDREDWKGRILLLESSEEKPAPEMYRRALEYLKEAGVFDVISGVLAGKPMDNTYAEEYKKLLVEVIDRPDLPVVFNLNAGHAQPRCIIPFGVEATVDTERQLIRFAEK